MATSVKEPTLPDPSPELVHAIGDVATRWASFELHLDANIWLLSGIDDVDLGACITAQIANSARKLDAIIALAAQRGCSKALLKELRSFAGKSDGLRRRRNRIVHDVWVSSEAGTHYRLEMTAAKTLIFEHTPDNYRRSEEMCCWYNTSQTAIL